MKKIFRTYSVKLLVGLGLMLFLFTSCGYFWKALVYQKVDIDDYKIFHNNTIAAGEYHPWAIAPDFNQYTLPDSVENYFTELQSVAYVVIQNQELVFEKYWAGYSDSALSNSFSAAKSIVSLLVGAAIEEGKIGSVDDPVSKYVKEFDNETNRNLRIRDVLTMSSGLNWHEAYANPWSKTTRAYYGTKLERMITKLKVKTEPGKKFHYFSGDTELLAIIVRRATGKTLAEYASEKLWSKIGARYDAIWSVDHKGGIEKAYCCFNTNARDFARFGQLVLNKGKWNGQQVISSQWIEESLKPASHLIDKETGKSVDFYGYQWWMLNRNGTQVFYARGLAGQYIFIIPDKNMVVVRMGHKRSKERINNLPADIYRWIDVAVNIEKSRN